MLAAGRQDLASATRFGAHWQSICMAWLSAPTRLLVPPTAATARNRPHRFDSLPDTYVLSAKYSPTQRYCCQAQRGPSQRHSRFRDASGMPLHVGVGLTVALRVVPGVLAVRRENTRGGLAHRDVRGGGGPVLNGRVSAVCEPGAGPHCRRVPLRRSLKSSFEVEVVVAARNRPPRERAGATVL